MSSVRIAVPASLRTEVEGRTSVEVDATTVAAALQQLVDNYPQLQGKLLDASGLPHSFINVFVNQRSIREMQGLETPLTPGDQVLLVPALSGG